MRVEFKSFEDWGESGVGTFCISDFKDISNDLTNYYMTGIILENSDMDADLTEVIALAAEAGSAIIMIECCNLVPTAKTSSTHIAEKLNEMVEEMESYGYRDLLSYEHRIAFGLTDETDEQYAIGTGSWED